MEFKSIFKTIAVTLAVVLSASLVTNVCRHGSFSLNPRNAFFRSAEQVATNKKQASNSSNQPSLMQRAAKAAPSLMGTAIVTGLFQSVGGALAKPAVELAQSSGYLDADTYTVMSNYCEDLTEMAREGKLHDAIGRDKEIASMIGTLTREGKGNPCVVGDSGVGKTALVEGMAYRIAKGDVPDNFKNKKVIKVNMVSLIAGRSYHDGNGAVSRMRALFDKAKKDPDMILFIDEFHQVVTVGAAELFKTYLDRGEIKVVAATTTSEYKYISNDPALERRFTRVTLEEPTEYETLAILKGLAPDMEDKNNVKISESAMMAAVDLTGRYMKNKAYPDKAIDVIRSAIQDVRSKDVSNKDNNVKETAVVTDEDIIKIVSSETNVPIGKITPLEIQMLESMDERIKYHIVGQDVAIKTMCDAVRRGRAGISDPERPRASVLFAGQSGVGKTALAELVGAEVGGLISIDLTHYSTPNALSELIGSKIQGYKGELIEKIWKKPYSVVLFENIEKSDPYVLSTILNIAQKGYLVDSSGAKVDFRNSIIILTTNIGEDIILNADDNESYDTIKQEVVARLEYVFNSSELTGKLDDVVVFDKFRQENVKEILSRFISTLENQLSKSNIKLNVSDDALEHLADLPLNNKVGARQLRRIIQEKLEKPIADLIIRNQLSKGQIATCVLDENHKLKFEIK